MGQFRHRALLLLLLLAGAFLRLHDLPQTPPGMTHDEADHGLDAWSVVEGARPLYFTVGYGREPLYDYSTAALMSFLGPSYLAGRLTAVFFSLLLLAGVYAWVRRAFDRQTALLTAAGLALSFWPVMVARHALRTVTMPALFVLVVVLFWRAAAIESGSLPGGHSQRRKRTLTFAAAGALLGLTFYTYFPARIMWLLFPTLLVWLALLRRPLPWRGTALMLLLAGAVAAPLFAFLAANPAAEARLDQLATPLEAATEGNFEPLLDNAVASLRTFTFTGDTLWRYNVPGRPLLPWALGLFFYAGLALAAVCVAQALWRTLRKSGDAITAPPFCAPAPALFMALAWLIGGFSPALITGPEASTTRVAAMQPVLYLFPALALTALARRSRPRFRWLLPLAGVLLFSYLFVDTARTYFHVWGTAPPVHVQYESNIVRAAGYLNDQPSTAAAVSTNEPDRFHDPATARMFLQPALTFPRWFDGRHSLLVPGEEEAVLLVTPEAPLHPTLADLVQGLATDSTYLPAPAGAGERLVVHRLGGHFVDNQGEFGATYPQFSTEINSLSTELSTSPLFGDAVSLLAQQSPDTAQPGETILIVTFWRVEQPTQEELVLFTHLLPTSGLGQPLAQADRLDAPSVFWQAGDLVIQLHELRLPADLPAGDYPLDVGFYHRADWRRRLPLALDGEATGDALHLATLRVRP